ncbi:MAG: c-type cytochrome [Deltaproteobacteria bacterium]|nr:c-type cytochrome [Deltaproteobacteria bacterium]
MTRRIVIGVVVVVSVVAIVLGPQAFDYLRFERNLADAAKASEADGGAWPQRADECTLCHGHQGDSVNQVYADLAGQPAEYLAAQLHAFADGHRASPFMAPLAMTLNDGDVDRLSAHFARQTATNNDTFAPDAALSAQGKHLSGSCAACHGDRFMGRDRNPRLAGQGYDYLLAQMNAYADNTRSDPTGAMNALAAALSDVDRRAVATYLASYPVAENVEGDHESN